MRESSAEGKLLLDQNLAEEAVLLPDGKCQPRDADGDCADDVGEGFGHIVGVSYAGFWVEATSKLCINVFRQSSLQCAFPASIRKTY